MSPLPVGELKLRERARPPVEEHTAHRWPKPQTRCVCFLCQAGALGVGTQPRSSLVPLATAVGRLWPGSVLSGQSLFGAQAGSVSSP